MQHYSVPDQAWKGCVYILDDYFTKPRLASGRGNAMLVASLNYEACQYYEIFQAKDLKKFVRLWHPTRPGSNTEDREYSIYQKMLIISRTIWGDYQKVQWNRNRSLWKAVKDVVH